MKNTIDFYKFWYLKYYYNISIIGKQKNYAYKTNKKYKTIFYLPNY